MRPLRPATHKNARSFLTGSKAKQNFTNTDYAFKLYNQAHPDRKMTLPKEPKFSDFYQSSEAQKQGELLFVGGSALALGYAAFHFL